MADDIQVYITGVLWNESAFPDTPDDIFSAVDFAFRQIPNLDFWSLNVNRSETRFSNSTTREQLLLFMKDVVYDGNSWLSATNATTLRSALITALNGVENLTYDDVEIRCTHE